MRIRKTLSVIVAAVAMAAALTVPTVTSSTATAHADEATCTGTPDDPIYPNYDSSKVLATYTNTTAGEIDIRHGFYCVPAASAGNLALESKTGFGFGLDKVQNRHAIGRPQDGWKQAEAIRAVKFVLSAPNSNVTSKTDEWGFGWNFAVYAVGGTECPKGSTNANACKNQLSVPVIGASTEGGAANDPRGGMPAGDPLGLQTVYCDYGDANRLRCDLWVTAALIKGAEGQKIN
jgi:hypothetical protein